jgi:glycosyltransferase involved in cell wall biosynthesis
MITISGIVITKNNEDTIARCLQSLSFCDEIIIIDAHSTDNTTLIAKKMGAKIIEESYNDFSKQRTAGLLYAKGKWVFYLDSDEVVSDELQITIKDVTKKNNKAVAAYKIKRKNFYFGTHPWPYIEKIERLFLREKLEGWFGKLHESPKIKGDILELDSYLFHYSHQDLSSMVKKTNLWSETESRLRVAHNHPQMTTWRFFRVMFTGLYNSYIKQEGWKAGTTGIVESIYQSFSMFITYAKLWELQTHAYEKKNKI